MVSRGQGLSEVCLPPDQTKRVVLFADNDDDAEDGGAKSREVYENAARLISRMHKVLIVRPKEVGWDANDFFRNLPQEQAKAGVRNTIRNTFQGGPQ